ncbi:hypothetical protein CY35_05G138100 [Sphagnum magellanicum]|nr:hypothetical protein CY35_05G138100 [Sphagnum magellanicum]
MHRYSAAGGSSSAVAGGAGQQARDSSRSTESSFQNPSTFPTISYIKFAVYHGCGPKIAIKKKLQSSVHELQIPFFYTGQMFVMKWIMTGLFECSGVRHHLRHINFSVKGSP